MRELDATNSKHLFLNKILAINSITYFYNTVKKQKMLTDMRKGKLLMYLTAMIMALGTTFNAMAQERALKIYFNS